MEKQPSQQISTRRKSCVACVKAKRRCDLQHPSCTRCITRGLLCNYPLSNPVSGINLQYFDLGFECGAPYANITGPTYQFNDFLSPALVPAAEVGLSKDRLDVCVQFFKDYLTNIVRHGQTSFIHSHLYNDALPPCLQDVYLVCAAYVCKTETNQNLIFGILSSKLADLVSRRQYCSFEVELASLQALIIYQIIRLFDGDIRQRGIAEAHFPVMEMWAIQLRQRGQLELPCVQASPYRNWVLIESVRRTILMSIFLRAIYSCIKEGFCDKVPEMAGLPLTVRGDLWEIKSEGEWIQATRGSQPDVLPYHEFVDRWDGGPVGGDVEGFQKMLLVACIGEEGLQTRFLESLTKGVGWT